MWVAIASPTFVASLIPFDIAVKPVLFRVNSPVKKTVHKETFSIAILNFVLASWGVIAQLIC
jgi:hypothetical protein